MAAEDSLSFRSNALAYAETIWNRQLGMFQQVSNLHHTMTGSVITGMVGQIRTKFIDFVADLTANTPLTELPGKDRVDAALHDRIGDVYSTTISNSSGPVAIGAMASATVEGLTTNDALRLLEEVRESAKNVDEEWRTELLEAVAELRSAVEQETPDTGEVVKRARRLRAIADKVGITAVSAATGSATSVLAELALNGAFG